MPSFTERGVLSPLQFAYRPNSSTMLETAKLKEAINKHTAEGSNGYACLMDMDKAFERVHHDILFQKLNELNIAPRNEKQYSTC